MEVIKKDKEHLADIGIGDHFADLDIGDHFRYRGSTFIRMEDSVTELGNIINAVNYQGNTVFFHMCDSITPISEPHVTTIDKIEVGETFRLEKGKVIYMKVALDFYDGNAVQMEKGYITNFPKDKRVVKVKGKFVCE